ncbi:MAG TPA: cob(I)yrinic acid a,c-diamide adenosyltransferase [Elusimicrobia bacterium]|nr:cob(I)yrinic acid a,c-diamide adenosyltransferase [Elusimicrobiota bacterium]
MKTRLGKGDDGTTRLADGTRVRKSDPRVAACGELDELNCRLGAARAALPRRLRGLSRSLLRIQTELFEIGGRKPPPGRFVRALELELRAMQTALPSLEGFVLPGGRRASVELHLARSACRRAERAAAALSRPAPGALPYLNRLSDWLFAAARRAS